MAFAHSLQTSELFDYTIFDVQINESQFSYEFIIKYGALERDFTLLKQETIIKLSRSIYNSILSLENDIIEEEKIEKDRMESLNKEKAKFVKQQQALNSLMIISETAVAVAKAQLQRVTIYLPLLELNQRLKQLKQLQ